MSKRANNEDFDHPATSTNQKADEAPVCKSSKRSRHGKQVMIFDKHACSNF